MPEAGAPATVAAVLGASAKIFLLVVLGYILARRGILNAATQAGLSRIAYSICVPCLLFDGFLRDFDRAKSVRPDWYLVPVLGLGLVLFTAALAWAVSLFFRGNPLRREWFVLTVFHNAVYLSLPILQALFPRGTDRSDRVLLYLSLIIFAYSPLLWSVPAALLRGRGARAGEPVPRGEALPAPFVAVFLGLALGLLGLLPPLTSGRVFRPAVELVRMLGDATIPLMLMTLGGILALMDRTDRLPMPLLLAHLGMRFVLVPAAALGFCLAVRLPDPLWELMLVLQAAMPASTALAVIVKRFGGRDGVVGHAILVSYPLAAIAIPAWLLLYRHFAGSW